MDGEYTRNITSLTYKTEITIIIRSDNPIVIKFGFTTVYEYYRCLGHQAQSYKKRSGHLGRFLLKRSDARIAVQLPMNVVTSERAKPALLCSVQGSVEGRGSVDEFAHIFDFCSPFIRLRTQVVEGGPSIIRRYNAPFRVRWP